MRSRQLEQLLEIGRDHEDATPRSAPVADALADGQGVLHVEPVGGLVVDDDPRASKDSSRAEHDLLDVAAEELPDRRVARSASGRRSCSTSSRAVASISGGALDAAPPERRLAPICFRTRLMATLRAADRPLAEAVVGDVAEPEPRSVRRSQRRDRARPSRRISPAVEPALTGDRLGQLALPVAVDSRRCRGSRPARRARSRPRSECRGGPARSAPGSARAKPRQRARDAARAPRHDPGARRADPAAATPPRARRTSGLHDLGAVDASCHGGQSSSGGELADDLAAEAEDRDPVAEARGLVAACG